MIQFVKIAVAANNITDKLESSHVRTMCTFSNKLFKQAVAVVI